MKNLFKGIDRLNSDCCKWDLCEEELGIKKSEINSFWIADSDYQTCPKVKKALIKRAKHGIFGYTFAGNEYYKSLSEWVKNNYGYDVSKNNTVITSGVVNALYFVVKTFTEENDNIVVNSPVYNPFYDVIKNNNRNIINSPLIKKDIDETLFTYEFDFLDLEEKIKNSKMYILCNPHNPVGRCYKYSEIEKIVNLCKKYNCILVSDEIHCDLIMPSFTFTSAGKFFKEYDNIVICTAPSKTFNVAGLGDSNIFFGNNDMFNMFNKAYSELNIIHNIFGLTASSAAYKYGYKWVLKQNEYLASQAKMVYDFAKEEKVKVCKLEATYLMWLDLSRLNMTQEELIDGLIKKKIWINSGTKYDDNAIGYIRINIACSKKQLKIGLTKLGEFIKEKEK